jgi:hypothetical protein
MAPLVGFSLLIHDPSLLTRGSRLTAHGSPVTAQAAPIRYQAGQLACAAFAEEVRTTVEARRAMESWTERGTRAGRLVVSAVPGESGLRFEAWYDSLEISQDGLNGMVRPDTDGLIGGRWQGTLAPHGEATLEVRPFIPPELLAVSDLSDALLDFFPPLATSPLRAGGRWTDSLGLTIERLRDSVASGETLERYRWRIASEGGPEPIAADTVARLRQRIRVEGDLTWSRSGGPLAWQREIVVDAQVSAARGPRSPIQSRVTQTITVRRLTSRPRCG